MLTASGAFFFFMGKREARTSFLSQSTLLRFRSKGVKERDIISRYIGIWRHHLMSKLTLISCDYLHVLLNRCKEMHSLHRQRQCIEWDSNGLCLRCCIDDTSTRKESHLLMYICWNSSASYKDEQLYISFMLSWNRSNAREYRSCGIRNT